MPTRRPALAPRESSTEFEPWAEAAKSAAMRPMNGEIPPANACRTNRPSAGSVFFSVRGERERAQGRWLRARRRHLALLPCSADRLLRPFRTVRRTPSVIILITRSDRWRHCSRLANATQCPRSGRCRSRRICAIPLPARIGREPAQGTRSEEEEERAEAAGAPPDGRASGAAELWHTATTLWSQDAAGTSAHPGPTPFRPQRPRLRWSRRTSRAGILIGAASETTDTSAVTVKKLAASAR